MKWLAIVLIALFALSAQANTGNTVEVIFPCVGEHCSTVFQTAEVGDKVVVLDHTFTVLSVGQHTVALSLLPNRNSTTLVGFTRTRFDVDHDGVYDVEIAPAIYRQNAVTLKLTKISEQVPNFKKPTLPRITPKVEPEQSPVVPQSEVLPETMAQEPKMQPVEAEVEIETKVVQQQTRWQTFTTSASELFAGLSEKITLSGVIVTVTTILAGLLIYWLIMLLL